MKAKLTDRTLKAIKPPPAGQRLEIIDEHQRALRLRVTDSGVMTWSISKRINGRRRRFTIGNYPTISISQARERAGRMLAEVQDGRDPVVEARIARIKTSEATSMEDALRFYKAAVLTHRRTGRVIERDLRRDLAKLLPLPVNEISKLELAHIVDKKATTSPTAANRLVATLRPFWRWMAARGHCDLDIAYDLERPAPETARDRVLSKDELRAVWTAAEGMPYPWGPFFRLALLTAQRRTEVASIRWSEVDLDAQTWVIPGSRTKTNREHVVHLAAPAIQVLEDLAERAQQIAEKSEQDTPDLIFTKTGHTPISGFSKAKRKLDRLSGVTDWRLHDFRRCFASHMADVGIDPTVVDRVLNHVAAGTQGTVARTYQRSAMLSQRKHALEAWGAFVLALVTKPIDNVVRLAQ